METIGFIGGGNMAEALIKGITSAGVFSAENILVSDVNADRLSYLADKYKVGTCPSNQELVSKARIVVLSVKPQNINDVLVNIKGAVSPDKLIVSIAAGIKTGHIAEQLGDIAIVRVMPNTPAFIGEAASAIYANEKAKPMLEQTKALFSAVGKVFVLETEDLIDAVTAVSGSGPAYYFILMEEMVKTALELGLPEQIAKDVVVQTAKGSILLAVQADKEGETPKDLRIKVTSPGGTTEAALKVFANGKFGPMISEALKAARNKSRELSTQHSRPQEESE